MITEKSQKTQDILSDIKRDYIDGLKTMADIARKYDVTRQYIFSLYRKHFKFQTNKS